MPDTPQHLAPDPAGDRASPPRWRRRLPVAVLVAAVLTVAVTAGVIILDDGGPTDDVATTAAASSTTTHEPPTTVPSTTSTTGTTVPTTSTSAPPSTATTTAAPAVVPPSPSPPAAAGGALCIGDSVMLGASPQFLDTLSMCATVDAEQSRQFSSAPAAVAAHAPLPAAVVVHLGNNGTVDRDDVDAVMAQLAGVPRVVFVTVQLNGTRSWEDQANSEIRAAPDRFPNVVIADWKAASDGHRDYAREDGIHMSPAGAGAYAATIAAAL